jgi:hypothetical protein
MFAWKQLKTATKEMSFLCDPCGDVISRKSDGII